MNIKSFFQQEHQITKTNVEQQGIGEIWALAVLGKTKIVTGNLQGNLHLYVLSDQLNSCELKNTVKEAHGKDIPITAITAYDQNSIASGGENGSIKLWNIVENALNNVAEIKYHNNNVRKIILLKNNNLFASCSFDKTIKIWNKTSPYALTNNSTYINEWNKVNSIIQLQNENLLVDSWGTNSGYITVWDMPSCKRLGSIVGVFTGSPYGLIELKNKHVAVSQNETSEIVIINPYQFEIITKIKNKAIIGQSSLLAMPNDCFIYACQGNYVQVKINNNGYEVTKAYSEDKQRNEKVLKNLNGDVGLFLVDNKYIVTNNNSYGFGYFTY